MATRTSLPGWLAAATLASFAIHTGLLVNSVESELWREQGQDGRLLARQLAEAAAPAVLAQDMVSLSVLLGRYEGQPGISSIKLYNSRNELLSQSGQDTLEERRFSVPLQVQGQSLGQVDLYLKTPARGDVLGRNAANIGVSALLHLGLLSLMLLGRAGQQNTAVTSTGRVTATETTAPVSQSVTLLHLTLDDPNQLLLRVNANTADELLTVFDHLLDRSARLYGGEVLAPFSPEGTTVRFTHEAGASKSRAALLCGQLFLQLSEQAQSQRRAANLFCLPVKGGLHEASADGDSARHTAHLLALTAPTGRLLVSTQELAPETLALCELGQRLALALADGRELPIGVLERLLPEYQQLINNQSQQLLAVNQA